MSHCHDGGRDVISLLSSNHSGKSFAHVSLPLNKLNGMMRCGWEDDRGLGIYHCVLSL